MTCWIQNILLKGCLKNLKVTCIKKSCNFSVNKASLPTNVPVILQLMYPICVGGTSWRLYLKIYCGKNEITFLFFYSALNIFNVESTQVNNLPFI